VKNHLAREGTEMIEDGISEPTSSSSSPSSSGGSETVSGPGTIKKRKLSSWLKETIELQSASSTPQTPVQKLEREIENNLKLPLLDADLDPLHW